MYESLFLTQPIAESLRAGHPWVWADAVRHRRADVETGDPVEILDEEGAFVGRGIFDGDSPLRVRLWTLDRTVRVDDALLEERIKAARRRRIFPTHDTTGFRLVHGEGDRVPGLVVDIYGDVVVLRPDGVAAERWLEPAREVIGRLFNVAGWVIRRSSIYADEDRPVAEWWGDERPDGRDPERPDVVAFQEHGVRYECDVISGQKTGFFLDQRANRARIARQSVGRRVLNLFGYTGGFSLAAAMKGAARTTTVDLAGPAIEQARRHFESNGFPPKAHEFVVSDVFEYLERFAPASAPFEVAVCDPPSFAHKRRDVERATEAYTRLFAKVMEVMPTGSTVALCSCSSHIGRDAFLEIVGAAASRAHVALVLAGVHGADMDHPVLPGFAEGDYLQCVIGTIEPL